MKHLSKLTLALLLSVLMFYPAKAEEKAEKAAKEKTEKVKKEKSENEDKTFNKSFARWSLEVNGGFNALVPLLKTIVSPGATGKYSTSKFGPFHVDLGARYMFNRFVGLKSNVSYDQVSKGWGIANRKKAIDNGAIKDFKGHYYGVDVEAVVNLGQAMHLTEIFGNRLGLLFHTGVGYRAFKLDNSLVDLSVPGSNYNSRVKRDNVVGVKWGITPQIRLFDRMDLTVDFSQIFFAKQTTQLNGTRDNRGPIDALLHTYSVGLTYNIGKKPHIDWAKKDLATKKFVEDMVGQLKQEVEQAQDATNKDIANMKTKIDDLAKQVNNAATTQDIDNLREELNKTINDKLNNIKNEQGSVGKDAALMDFINQGLLVVYFDFNARTPQASSVELIKQVADYLKSNPNAKVKLVGYADAVGGKAYNNKLAQDRADNVKKLLVEQGIAANTINAFSGGIDNTASINDEAARSLVRRVTFNVIK